MGIIDATFTPHSVYQQTDSQTTLSNFSPRVAVDNAQRFRQNGDNDLGFIAFLLLNQLFSNT